MEGVSASKEIFAILAGSLCAGLFFVHLIVPESFDATKIIIIALIATVVEGASRQPSSH